MNRYSWLSFNAVSLTLTVQFPKMLNLLTNYSIQLLLSAVVSISTNGEFVSKMKEHDFGSLLICTFFYGLFFCVNYSA